MTSSIRRGAAGVALLALLAACEGTPASPTPGVPTATPAPVSPAITAAVPAPTTAPTPAPPAPGSGDGNIDRDRLYHESRDSYYRAPGGAVPAGTAVTLRFRSAAGDLTGVTLRAWDARQAGETLVPMVLEQRTGGVDLWRATVQTPATPGILWYRFLAQDGNASAAYEDDRARDGGTGEALSFPNDRDYGINAYDPAWTIPDWVQDAVVYQVFPDRFNNGDPGNDQPPGLPAYDEKTTTSAWDAAPKGSLDFFGGDLQGVIAKLDYLQSLGVTAIYFNPIFDSPTNHGYDTRDYTKIAPRFGTAQTFRTLVAEAGQRNIHLILDGVFNHSGSDSLYFDRYHQYDTLGAYESQTSPYFAWYRFSHWPDTYATFATYDTLPAFSEKSDAVREFLYRKPDSIAQRWLAAGAAGWRLDAADLKTDAFWRDFRQYVRNADPDALIIGEFWHFAGGWLSGDEWDGVMNYRFRDAAWDFFRPGSRATVDALDAALASVREDYPPNAVLASMNLIDSHDTERALTIMGGDKNRLRLLALLQFTSAGAPTIYYGDEAGLAGGRDPDDRRTYPWGSEDTSLIQFYSTLAQTRHAISALRTGETHTLLRHNDNRLYAFARTDRAGTAVVAFNAGAADQVLDLDLQGLVPDGTMLKDLLTNNTPYTVQGGHVQVKVTANWGALLR